MSNDELLDKQLTYHEFCDALSSAWLAAEQATDIYPDKKFRLAFLTDLEKRVEGYKGWRWVDNGVFVDVVPLNDTKPHDLGDECWCKPRRVEDPGERPVISHNALDGRK